MEIWLHEGHDGEAGLHALCFELLGFTTWAPAEPELRAKLPGKLAEYRDWRARHGVPAPADDRGFEVVGRLSGNEIVLPPDCEPAAPTEIELAIRLLACSRADLVAQLESGPEGALDWDPPYRRFASWADWRTIRANLAHIANGETQYYTRNVGHEPEAPPADPHGDWREFLPRTRAEAVAFLETLVSASDRVRLCRFDLGYGGEVWTVRKALRRIVSHEIVHTKSIARIIRAYRDRPPPPG